MTHLPCSGLVTVFYHSWLTLDTVGIGSGSLAGNIKCIERPHQISGHEICRGRNIEAYDTRQSFERTFPSCVAEDRKDHWCVWATIMCYWRNLTRTR